MRLLLRILGPYTKRHPRLALQVIAASLATSALWVVEPLYSSYAVDTLLTLKDGATVNYWMLGLAWGAIYLAVSLAQGLHKNYQWAARIVIEMEELERAFSHLLSLPVSYFASKRSGEAMKTVDDGATEVGTLTLTLLDFIPSIVAAVAFIIVSIVIEWRLAVPLLIILILSTVMVIYGTKKLASLQDEVNALWLKPVGNAYDAIANIFSVKSGAQERREQRGLQTLNRRAFDKQMRINKWWALLEGINFFMLTRILLLLIGVILLTRGELSLGSLYFFQFSFYRVLTPFEMLGSMLPQWNRSMSKVKMLRNLYALPPEPWGNSTIDCGIRAEGEIAFRDVCFTYQERRAESSPKHLCPDHGHLEEPPAEQFEGIDMEEVKEELEESDGAATSPSTVLPADWRATIQNLSLRIEPGEHLAIVGPSGAGKSTLAMLLNRFYDVTCGQIFIDGADLRTIDLGWWRSQIGLVLQDNLMFNATILENIRYARPSATIDEVREAAVSASADEFIASLPQGYETEVGERGMKLSGGQRQRLAIARAILKNPSVVILDEATSALDSLTEQRVQEGIETLLTGRTSLIIAHRLSTVRSADRIAVLDRGSLVACAPHDELLHTCAMYRGMVELQNRGMLAE